MTTTDFDPIDWKGHSGTRVEISSPVPVLLVSSDGSELELPAGTTYGTLAR